MVFEKLIFNTTLITNKQLIRDVVEYAGAHAVAAGSIFVYYGPRNAVLINYPKESELREIELI